METIVILPGLSSPEHERYRPYYDLLREQANARGLTPVVLRYKGQMDDTGGIDGSLSPQEAVQDAMRMLRNFADQGQPFQVLGLSFGCFVAMSCALQMAESSFFQKLTLWAPIPYWMNWEAYTREERDTRFGNGTEYIQPQKRFLDQLAPDEYLLMQQTKPIHVCLGSDDKYIPKEFLFYLAQLCQSTGKNNVTFSLVQNCAHNVSQAEEQNWRGYIDAVFS